MGNFNINLSSAFIDYILTNSPEKVIQSGVIEMGLSKHELIYHARIMSLFKIK